MTRPLTGCRVLAVAQPLDPIARAVLQDGDLRLVTVRQLDAALKAGPQADLIVIDGDGADVSLLIPALEALAGQAVAPPVLVTGARLPTRLVRAVLQLPRADLLETPFDAAGFGEAVDRLLASPASPNGARCWSVMGTVGGCGTTTIAIEIAAALAAQKPSPRVCLVDLNLADGAAAAYLGASANMALSSAASAERIDAALLSAFVSSTGDGFDLLAAPRNPDAFNTVPPDVVTRVLELACSNYDWVLVDLPRHRQPWTLDVVSGSDELVLVSELTVPALLAARAQAAEIEACATGAPPLRIVLNRLASRLLAAAPSLKEAQNALGRTAAGGISSDWEAATASVNLGGVIRRHRPRSKIVRDIDQLVRQLINEPGHRVDRTRAA
jgi:pilus assembly protein CpaE